MEELYMISKPAALLAAYNDQAKSDHTIIAEDLPALVYLAEDRMNAYGAFDLEISWRISRSGHTETIDLRPFRAPVEVED